MLSKRVIMKEWRDVVRSMHGMNLKYADGKAAAAPPNSPEDALRPPGSPARAPASLGG